MARLYHDEGLSLEAVGRRYGVTRQTVARYFRDAGVTVRVHQHFTGPGELEAVAELYRTYGFTRAELAADFGVSETAIAGALDRAEVARRSTGRRPGRSPLLELVPDIAAAYFAEGSAGAEVERLAERFDLPRQTITRLLREAGYVTRRQGARYDRFGIAKRALISRLYSLNVRPDAIAAALEVTVPDIFEVLNVGHLPFSGATYHQRVAKTRGRPAWCEACGSFNPECRYEWANQTGRYDDVWDYARLCKSCHVQYDARRRRAERARNVERMRLELEG
jgi:transcriptional regulator with XRE-family HTH domain